MAKTPEVNLNDILGNYIINGSLDFWQRNDPGATGVDIGTFGGYYADRFKTTRASSLTSTFSIYRLQDSPNGQTDTSLAVKTTTAAATIAASDWSHPFGTTLEGQMVKNLYGKTVSLIFWVKSTQTGEHCVIFRDAGVTHSYVATYQINQANTWEKKKITLTLDNTLGTWNTDNQSGFSITFGGTAGSSLQTSQTNQWVAGNFVGSTNMVQYGSILNAQIQFAQIMLLEGDVEPDYFIRAGGDYASELRLCQRYYAEISGEAILLAHGPSQLQFSTSLPVPMRVLPTITTGSMDIVSPGLQSTTFVTTSTTVDTPLYSVISSISILVNGNSILTGGRHYIMASGDYIKVDADF